jgi:uracil-DNA glycosylase family 4
MSSKLDRLVRDIVTCQRCPRLRTWCTDIARTKKKEFQDWTYWGRPVPGFGDPKARVFIVGLAPAAHGANRTGRMFTGDSSGDWLYEALHRYGFANQPASVSKDDGLRLSDAWIGASARCAPPDNKPTIEELDTCQRWLEREIELLDRVRVVITLGSIAHERWLKASGWWKKLRPSERPKFAHGADATLGHVRLLASYHPSRQNTNTGKLTRPMWHAIFATAREWLESETPRRSPAGRRR